MDRIELHWNGFFIATMIVLGLMSCGMVPLLIWLISAKDYPTALDAEGVTMRGGQRLLWKDLTEKRKLIVRSGGRSSVTGIGLYFGKRHVKIAPRVLIEGRQAMDFLSRLLGEELSSG